MTKQRLCLHISSYDSEFIKSIERLRSQASYFYISIKQPIEAKKNVQNLVECVDQKKKKCNYDYEHSRTLKPLGYNYREK